MTVSVVVAAALVGLLAACETPAEDGKERSGISKPSCDVTSWPTPEEGDKVTVVDTGYSIDRDHQGRPRISFGAVLRNESSNLVAGRLEVRIRVLDTSGNLLTFSEDSDSPTTKILRAGWLRPGERIGFGGYAYLTKAPAGKLPETADVDVKVTGGSWFTTCAFTMQRLGVSDVKTSRKGSTATVRFTAKLPASCTFSELDDTFARAQVIYYDRSGKIVGGDGLEFETHDLEDPLADHPDRVTGTAHIPADADPRRTKVYALGGCAGSPPSATPK